MAATGPGPLHQESYNYKHTNLEGTGITFQTTILSLGPNTYK